MTMLHAYDCVASANLTPAHVGVVIFMEGWQQDRGQAADAVQACKQSPVLGNLKGSSCQLSAGLKGSSCQLSAGLKQTCVKQDQQLPTATKLDL